MLWAKLCFRAETGISRADACRLIRATGSELRQLLKEASLHSRLAHRPGDHVFP